MAVQQLMFSMRIVSVDSYMSNPIPGLDLEKSDFRKSDIKSVPVVRVFGSTPSGQTTCLHLHGVFPYLMIPYCGPDVMESHWTEIEKYMHQLAISLDTALNSASGKGKSSRQRVFKIVLLRGIPFYGYHQDEELFLKIYFYLPGDIKRASDLLQAGAVMDRQFQPHEAHVPYILQLFLDYNLYGMNLIHSKNTWFRLPVGKPDPIDKLPQITRPDDVPAESTDASSTKKNMGKVSDKEEDLKLAEKYNAPSMSQLRNFNWNLLREKAQSTYSQQRKPQDQETDDLGDSEVLPSTSSIRRTSKIEDFKNISQGFSCSNLCKSLLSRTLMSSDSRGSEDLSESLPACLCPLHTHWSEESVPSFSKLPSQVERHSTCDLEVDVLAADVVNRDELANASTKNPGIASIWEDERARRKERGEDSQITQNQSQIRNLPDNLSEREARFMEMLYDALDRHKEDNSLTSFDDSLSFAASLASRKTSLEAGPSRRESKDLFSLSPGSEQSSFREESQDTLGISPGSDLNPIVSHDAITQVMNSTKSQIQRKGSDIIDDDYLDISTLELMNKLHEDDEDEIHLVSMQRGNGPLDDDNEQQTPEEFAMSQNQFKKQLSFSISNSQKVDDALTPSDSTQPIVPPSDDEDAIENWEMSQRWDSAIQDLLQDLSDNEDDVLQISDSDSDTIPQLDGASDEPVKGKPSVEIPSTTTVKRLGTTKRCIVPKSKSHENMSNVINSEDIIPLPESIDVNMQDNKDIISSPTNKNEENKFMREPSTSQDVNISVVSKTSIVKEILSDICIKDPKNICEDNVCKQDKFMSKESFLGEKQENCEKNKQIGKINKVEKVSEKIIKIGSSCCKKVAQTKDQPLTSARTHPCATGYKVKKKTIQEAVMGIKYFGGSEVQFCGSNKNFVDVLMKINEVQTGRSDNKNGGASKKPPANDEVYGTGEELTNIFEKMCDAESKKCSSDTVVKQYDSAVTVGSPRLKKSNLNKKKYDKPIPGQRKIKAKLVKIEKLSCDTEQSMVKKKDSTILRKCNSTKEKKCNPIKEVSEKLDSSKSNAKVVNISTNILEANERLSPSSSKGTDESSDSVLMKVEPRTNVFTTILNENPGVTLYDQTKAKPQKYKHSAIINLCSLPTNGEKNIGSLDDTLVKITSTPVEVTKMLLEKTSAARVRRNNTRKTNESKESKRPTRTRRPRSASKNAYVEDPLFETVFDSDWDSDKSEVFETVETSYPKRTRNKKTNEYKKRRSRKPRVITKWIIVNRFKGQSIMKVGLWKLPLTKRVKLTPELLCLYEMYSPKKGSIVQSSLKPPPQLPATQLKPRPMGRRSKHRLAINCPFGPLVDSGDSDSPNIVKSNNSPIVVQNSPQTNHSSMTKKLSAPEVEFPELDQKSTPVEKTSLTGKKSVQKKSHTVASEEIGESHGKCKMKKINNIDDPHSVSRRIGFHTKKPGMDEAGITDDSADKIKTKSCDLDKSPTSLPDKKSVSVPKAMSTEMHSVACAEDKEILHPKKDCGLIGKDVIKSILIKTSSDFEDEQGEQKQDENTHAESLAQCADDVDEDLPIAVAFAKSPNKKEVEKLEKETVTSKYVTNVDLAVFEKSPKVIIPDLVDISDFDRQTKDDKMKRKLSEFPDLLCSEKLSDSVEDSQMKNKGKIEKSEENRKSTKNTKKEMDEDDVMKTYPILSSIFAKSNKPVSKKTDVKRKNVKLKKDRKRSLVKLTRDSPSPPTCTNHLVIKSIVPVSSRTVEPLCNRISPVIPEPKDSESLPDFNMNTLVPDKPSAKKNKKVIYPEQVSVMPHIGKLSPHTKDIKSTSETDTASSPFSSPEKKALFPQAATTKRVYAPSRKVTRNSVAVKLNSISAPSCMFNTTSDDSMEPLPPKNALLFAGFPSPILDPPCVDVDPPRPWSPMHAPVASNIESDNTTQEETESDDLLESFAESFGADATKILDLDESVFKNMDCIDQLISDNATDNNQEADNGSTSKEDDDKLLKHFDKILENVSSNADSNSSGQLCKTQDSSHFDLFEEETLMEYIDELTSPTQQIDSTLSDSLDNSLPIPPVPTQQPNKSTSQKQLLETPKHLGMPACLTVENCSNSRTSTPMQSQKSVLQHHIQPLRPTSALSAPMSVPMQTPQGHIVNNNVVPPQMQNVIPQHDPNLMIPKHLKTGRPASVIGVHQHRMENPNQSQWFNHRPQSCHPIQHVQIPQQQQRSASAIGQWTDVRGSHSQPPCNENHFNMRNNMVSPNFYQFDADRKPQKRPDCAFYMNKNASSQPLPRPMSSYTPTPTPYQFHMDPGQMPMEPPLQVFHTHVHHHHHVHSINNQPDGVVNASQISPQQQQASQQTSHIQKIKVKTERRQQNIKVENNLNSPWPNLPTNNKVTHVQDRTVKPPEKQKAKKTQFYVPNSPFPFPTTIAPMQTGPKGLVQTLTYVETTMAQTFASGVGTGKRDFYAFAGINPSNPPTSTIFSQTSTIEDQRAVNEVPSILMKGSCQRVHYSHNMEQMSGCITPVASQAKKGRPRGRPPNSKTAWDPAMSLPTLGTVNVTKDQPVTAKTPYGLMKQNSLNTQKNRSMVPAIVLERKRKTISDFRAPPPNTPTISLTGGSAGVSKQDSETFGLSQDMFSGELSDEKNVQSSAIEIHQTKKSEAFSTYNFTFVSNNTRKALDDKGEKALKLTICKNSLQNNPSMTRQKRCQVTTHSHKFDSDNRPIPNSGEELILNFVTGEWEVAPEEKSPPESAQPFLPPPNILACKNTGFQLLPTLPKGSTIFDAPRAEKFGKRMHKNITKRVHTREQSSESDNLAEAKKKKRSCQSGSSEAKFGGKSEYRVSSVDFLSSSPKLTLKKTPKPSRGKPQISKLVSASDFGDSTTAGCKTEHFAKHADDIVGDSDSSDSDFAPSARKKQRRASKNIHSDSDSDFRIDNISETTDEASEVPDEIVVLPCHTNLEIHMAELRNMYVLKPKFIPHSTLVELDAARLEVAVTAMDNKVKIQKHAPIGQFVGRDSQGKFVSLAKRRSSADNVSQTCGTQGKTDVTNQNIHGGDATVPIPPLKIFRCGKRLSTERAALQVESDVSPSIDNYVLTDKEAVVSKSINFQDPGFNHMEDIRSLLGECCDIVANDLEKECNTNIIENVDTNTVVFKPSNEAALPDRNPRIISLCESAADNSAIDISIVGCTGRTSGSKTDMKNNREPVTVPCSVQQEQRVTVKNDGDDHENDDVVDPPSPPEDKSPSCQTAGFFKSASHIFRPAVKPPTREKVTSYVNELGLTTTTSSKPPFYGDASDVQSTTHRLTSLPPYIKKPKPNKTVQELEEFQSELSYEGGLHHHMVMATASRQYNSSETELLRQKASEILPPNVHVWDHLDAVTKLPQYPKLSKIFLQDAEKSEIILKPASKPPTRKAVEMWLKEKRNCKTTETNTKCKPIEMSQESAKAVGDTTDKAPCLIAENLTMEQSLHPTLQRSLSSPISSTKSSNRRRRVSFDLSHLNQDDKTISPVQTRSQRAIKRKLAVIVGSPNRPVLKADKSPSTSGLPFANFTSPVQSMGISQIHDSSMAFNTSPSFLSSVPVTPEGSSSAIKTLVGSSDQDKTSPLTFLISGSFTPPPCSTQDSNSENRDDTMLSSLKKLPQSTPNVPGGSRQRKNVLRKLAFTPIQKGNAESSEQITPIKDAAPPSRTSTPSPRPKTSQSTPSTKTNLRKIVLAKKFQPNDVPKDNSKHSAANPIQQYVDTSTHNSPLLLETPQTTKKREGSQIDGPTLDNSYGFKAAQQHLGEAKSLHVVQHITTLSIELHVKTRIDLRPDPDMDEIRCLFYCLDSDSWTGSSQGMKTGIIIVDPDSIPKDSGLPDSQKQSTSAVQTTVTKSRELFKKSGITHIDTLYVKTESDLFLLFAQLMHKWDPDILVGYEVQMLSWGFLLQRAAHLRCDLCRAISRIPTDEQRNRCDASKDVYGADNASELHVVGRLVLNLWRLMRTELALYDYGFESVAYHLLHERHPCYDHHTLTNWFDPPSRGGQVTQSHIHRWRVIDYYVTRARANVRLLQQQDLIDRTSELARLFGIQFYDVLTRGSQFRVESMMLRTARAHNLVAVTPSILQRAQMRAPEVIALVLEPESKFYHVPVLVLDFQSLYPSMVIGYNICFSTCLGRVEHLGSDAVFTFGCTSLRVPAKTLSKLLQKNLITINPSGVAFVKKSVRKGVMPQMLDEILTTRVMVKNSMKKLGPDDAAIRRMLDHRQLGLKLIANVTYGYTAANFSGRMPCVEVGDSIVHKARETLERAIHLVTRNSQRWCNARVVYGDTDSMFIALEGVNNAGCSKQKAFEIGKEIAAAVTADNPTPVKLKFEKVYLPCVLQTKKRYVGYSYETEDQIEPLFDAKGIETVRRDGTPAASKILEKMLKILFETRDVSQVKEYVLKQCTKLLDGKTTLQDCIIAKEYRGKQYYKPGAVVPALNIAKKLMAMDRRAEPRVGERVPYVIVHGAPGTPLHQLVRSPLEVLKDPSLHLNGAYYVTKQLLPALDRVLSLLGVDVFAWHRQLPRTFHVAHRLLDSSQNLVGKKATISQFFQSKHCLMCKKLSIKSLCGECLTTDNSRRQTTAVSLMLEAKNLERRKNHTEQVCMQCTGATTPSDIRCVSLDCPIIYKLHRAIDDSLKVKVIRKALMSEDMM